MLKSPVMTKLVQVFERVSRDENSLRKVAKGLEYAESLGGR